MGEGRAGGVGTSRAEIKQDQGGGRARASKMMEQEKAARAEMGGCEWKQGERTGTVAWGTTSVLSKQKLQNERKPELSLLELHPSCADICQYLLLVDLGALILFDYGSWNIMCIFGIVMFLLWENKNVVIRPPSCIRILHVSSFTECLSCLLFLVYFWRCEALCVDLQQ